MSNAKIPPKTPAPTVETINHHILSVNWSEINKRLQLILPEEESKCLAEISFKKINNFDEPWIVKYMGYADCCELEDFDQDSVYAYRIRLRNKKGWGDYSDEQRVQFPKEPVTGDDLHRAIIMNDEPLLLKLLQSGKVNLNTPDRYDYTPLMACAIRNLEGLFACLVDYKVDLDIQNKAGKTALMLSANKGNARIVQLLLSHGANAFLKDILGMTALFYAVDNENIPIVRLLLDYGCDVNDTDNENDWTPLIRLAVLANNGNPKIGILLLQHGADINKQDTYGNTALIHCAFHNSHQELAKVLLSHGANIEIKNKSGHNAYQISQSMNNTNITLVMEEFKYSSNQSAEN